MDKYTKAVFTVIAVCLLAIAIKMWEPTSAYSGFLDKGPIFGDLNDLRALEGEVKEKERIRIF
jgi:hypothetical protein